MITLKIILDDKGQVRAEGPLQDKILCFGLIEVAKLVISTGNVEPENKLSIIIPKPGMKVPIN